MIRSFTTELVPFLVAVGLSAIGFLYTALGVPVLVVVGVVYLLFRRLAALEYHVSDEAREALFWRENNRLLFEGFRWASAILLVGALHHNFREGDRYLPIQGPLEGMARGLVRAAARPESGSPAVKAQETARPEPGPKKEASPRGADPAKKEDGAKGQTQREPPAKDKPLAKATPGDQKRPPIREEPAPPAKRTGPEEKQPAAVAGTKDTAKGDLPFSVTKAKGN